MTKFVHFIFGPSLSVWQVVLGFGLYHTFQHGNFWVGGLLLAAGAIVAVVALTLYPNEDKEST